MDLSNQQPPSQDADILPATTLPDDRPDTEVNESSLQNLFVQIVEELKQLTSSQILRSVPSQLASLSYLLYKLRIWGVDIDVEDGVLTKLELNYKKESQAVRYPLYDAREAVDSITKNLQTALQSQGAPTESMLQAPPALTIPLHELEDAVEQLIALVEPIKIMVGLCKETGPVRRTKDASDAMEMSQQKNKSPQSLQTQEQTTEKSQAASQEAGMADPISTAFGLRGLVVFAFQSSKLLYQEVSSFQSSQRNIRELREELEVLDGVLQALQEIAVNTDTDLAMLKLPLIRCGKACKDFKVVIAKCTARSSGPRTNFRDWAKLKYMGSDIVEFKNMLAGYKSTIIIALSNANIRKSVVTNNVLQEYKELIINTVSDLEEHLQNINGKLQTFALQGTSISDEDAAEKQRMQEERDSTQQCLGICAKAYTQIDQVRPNMLENISTPPASYQGPIGVPSARMVTADIFKACTETLTNTTTWLERYLKDTNNRLQNFSSQSLEISNEQVVEKEKVQEEIDSIKQCLDICAETSKQVDQNRTNLLKDISMAEDGNQVLVSTIRDLISTRRVTVGARSSQLLSDNSLQQLPRDRVALLKRRL